MDSYEINKILMKSNVSKKQLIEIMYDALSIMQRYNGNTVGHCLEEAIRSNNLKSAIVDEIKIFQKRRKNEFI